MKIYEKRQIYESLLTDTQCDICGKLQSEHNYLGFYSFSSNRTDWGNDNVDSIELYDVCSLQCYLDKVKEIIEGEGIEHVEIDDKRAIFFKNILS